MKNIIGSAMVILITFASIWSIISLQHPNLLKRHTVDVGGRAVKAGVYCYKVRFASFKVALVNNLTHKKLKC